MQTAGQAGQGRTGLGRMHDWAGQGWARHIAGERKTNSRAGMTQAVQHRAGWGAWQCSTGQCSTGQGRVQGQGRAGLAQQHISHWLHTDLFDKLQGSMQGRSTP